MQDIIIFQKNTELYSENYWRVYEDSYKSYQKNPNYNMGYFINFKSYLNDVNDVFDFENEVENIKYSYYKVNEDTVKIFYFKEYTRQFYLKFHKVITDNIKNFFQSKKNIPDYLLTLLKFSNTFLETSEILDLIGTNIFEIIYNIKSDEIIELIKFNIYLDNFLNIFIVNIPENKVECFLDNMIKKIKLTYLAKITNLIKVKEISFLKDLLTKSYFKSLFYQKELIKYILSDVSLIDISTNPSNFEITSNFNDVKNLFCGTVIDLIIKRNNFENYEVSSEIIVIIEFINKINKYVDFSKYMSDIDTNKLTDYLCASFYYWIKENKMSEIETIVTFYSELNKVNKLEFLKLYSHNMQKRINFTDIKMEIEVFNIIKSKFTNKIETKEIDSCQYLIEDLKSTLELVNELRNLQVTISSEKFSNSNFDLQKINFIITSEFLWDSPSKYDIYKNSDVLDIYFEIIQKFYSKKYVKNLRKLNISYDESFIDFQLGNSVFRMPCSYFNVLEKIGNSTFLDSNGVSIKQILHLINGTPSNLTESEISVILNKLKVKNLIYQNNDRFFFNEDVMKSNMKINLYDGNLNDDVSLSEEIVYDKDMMIDSTIVKLCKRNEKGLSYNRLLSFLRNELSKYIIISNTSINKRIKKMIDLEYISEDIKDECKIYTYIP